MDIGIYDGDKLVRRYQAKFGKDTDATWVLFRKGDYRGQRKLVPAGQENEIPGATDALEMDGVRSTPLTKEAAKAWQEKAQRKREVRSYDWNDISRIEVAKAVGKHATVSAALSSGLHGARILARRVWNWLREVENPPPSEDLREFFDASIKSAKHTGVQVAVSGAVVVAAKQGWIRALQGTPPGIVANIAYVGMENAKVLYKLAKGELGAEEAMDAVGSTVGALAAAAKGAALATMLAPPLAPVAAFVGGTVGAIAGSKIGEAVYEAGKAIVKPAAKVVRSLYEGTKDIVRGIGQALNPFNWAC